MPFQHKTISQVIIPVMAELQKLQKLGYRFQSKARLYRLIEIMKFPETKRRESSGNVYGQQQYDTIVNYLVKIGMIEIVPSPRRKGGYNVIIKRMG